MLCTQRKGKRNRAKKELRIRYVTKYMKTTETNQHTSSGLDSGIFGANLMTKISSGCVEYGPLRHLAG